MKEIIMAKRIVRLTEADLTRLVKRVIKEQSQGPITVQGTTLDDLRNKMKAITNVSINPQSFKVDAYNNKITYESGNTPVKSLSFIFDNKKALNTRLPQIQAQNPSMKVAGKGNSLNVGTPPQDIQWAVVYFE